jgi:hypothetical protein
MRQNFVKTKNVGQVKNFVEYCKLSLKFWIEFAQVSPIFHGIKES